MYRDELRTYLQPVSDRFESYDHMHAHAITVDTKQNKLKVCGTPMTTGRNADELLTSEEGMHSFVIGETGSGKTRRVVYPMVRLLAKTGDSMIISDPKGEIYRNTAQYLKNNGYNVLVFNFRNPLKGHHWNPLGNIERLYRSGDPIKKEQALAELKDIADQLKEGIHSAKDTYWELVAGLAFYAFAQVILERGGPGDLSFHNISLLGDAFLQTAHENRQRQRRPAFTEQQEIIKTFYESLKPDSEIARCFSTLWNAAENTILSYQTAFDAMLAPYVNQSGLREMFKSDDCELNCFGKESTALFIVLPDDTAVMYFIATLLVQQIYKQLIKTADANRSGRLAKRTHFILDEFANFARIPEMPSMLTASRSRGISFTLVCQSMEQLIEKYDTSGAEILMANCRVWIYMNCRNLPFLRRMEELSGFRWNADHTIKEPLLTVSQLTHLQQGEVVVFNDRCNIYRGYLKDYSEIDFGESEDAEPLPYPSNKPSGNKGFVLETLFRKEEELSRREKLRQKSTSDWDF